MDMSIRVTHRKVFRAIKGSKCVVRIEPISLLDPSISLILSYDLAISQGQLTGTSAQFDAGVVVPLSEM